MDNDPDWEDERPSQEEVSLKSITYFSAIYSISYKRVIFYINNNILRFPKGINNAYQ